MIVKEKVVGPRDLQVSELSYNSLQISWSQATGDVTGYRLLIAPVSPKGHLLPIKPQQVRATHTHTHEQQATDTHSPVLLATFRVGDLSRPVGFEIRSTFMIPHREVKVLQQHDRKIRCKNMCKGK